MPVEIRVPQLGESIVEATVTRWLKSEGEAVSAGEPIVELETDKVSVDVPSEQAGVLARIQRGEGETVTVGDILGFVDESAAPQVQAASPKSPEPELASPKEEKPDHPASPLARRIAEEKGLDLRLVKGSGPRGRIEAHDVANYIERSQAVPSTAAVIAEHKAELTRQAVQAPPIQPERAPGDRPEERRRLSRRRQTIAARLVEAQRTAAMLTTFNEADMTAIMEIRKRRKEAFQERHGVGLGFMSFFTKAVVGALKSFPMLNAELQGDEVVVKGYYDIGVAVSTEEGLVVPVVRDADQKSFAAIEREILDLATRARNNTLTIPELQGGTFTITNGGIFGSLLSTPILNTPQVGILGMHKIQERPVVKDGQIVARPMMYLAMSYDHRLIDGAEAVRFLVQVKEYIESPDVLLLEG